MGEQPQLEPGTVVGGDFSVVSELAAGGMGALYVATQLSTGRRRALKVMHRGMVADPTLRDRFAQEARVGSMIPSDHVVEVVGAGVDATLGVPWIAMELLDGQDLSRAVHARGPMSLAELASVMRPLCHALGAAHRVGVVHRDVKPENVFLATTQSTTHPQVVKVLDFGIAKVAAQVRQTNTAAMGTPLWMAPEQTELNAPITPAADVWPLGLIAFWLLTGQSYWRAARAATPSLPPLMREILFEPLDPPSVRAAELGLQGRIPPGFDEWFARTTCRVPAQRFADAEAAHHALTEGVLQPNASLPPPSTTGVVTLASAPHAAPLPSAPHAAPYANTHAPSSVHAPSPAPARSAAPWVLALLLMGGVGIAALGAIALSVALLSEDAPTLAQPAPSARAPLAPATADDEPLPQPTASVEPKREPTRTTVPAKPKTSATGASGPPVTPPAASADPGPALGPFDFASAQKQVNQGASTARALCKNLTGPPAIAATVHFNPAHGGVSRVDMPHGDRTTPRGGCALGPLSRAKVAPFSGTGSVTTAVAF
ncbi:MAG: protein kinase [Polyangiaceae bacterium]|nr:protein kinase [Polyangiaceae bacterium]